MKSTLLLFLNKRNTITYENSLNNKVNNKNSSRNNRDENNNNNDNNNKNNNRKILYIIDKWSILVNYNTTIL